MLDFVAQPLINANLGFTTDWVLMGDNLTVFYQTLFTGADVAGTLTVEGSADKVHAQPIEDASFDVVSSGLWIFDIQKCGAKYVRLKWVYASGTGNVSVIATVKDIELATRSLLSTFPAP